MHPIARGLLRVSLSALPLVGCREVCHTPIRDVKLETAVVAEKAPELVAVVHVEQGLLGGYRQFRHDACVAVCGEGVSTCSLVVEMHGDAGRPSSSNSTFTCRYFGERTCTQDFDPLGLSSCPFGCGRLPSGFDVARLAALGHRGSASPLAAEFGRIAMFESLSVAAFAELSRHLGRLGLLTAPLAARLERVRADERRHARQARSVLRRLGARAARTPRLPRRARTLEQVAEDNAVDGCVREAFGAALACLQGRTARDPAVRAFFRAIAVDELRHAALSWDLHAVLWGRLPAGARVRVVAAQRRALEGLARGPEPHGELRERAGAPTRAERAELARTMATALPLEAA